MKKLCILLLTLMITTLVGPCFQCVTMEDTMPVAHAMILSTADTSTDCSTSMETSLHSEMKDCTDSSSNHHKVNFESNIVNQTSSGSHDLKGLLLSHNLGFNFHHLNLVFHKAVNRDPKSVQEIKKTPPSLPGIIVKKE